MNEVVVCVDVGSTYTKAAAVDAETGALRGTASHPTTLETDVMDGLGAAVADALPEGATAARTLVCSSAGGGLRLGVVGNEPLVTARAAYRAGLSAGAKVVHVCAGDMGEADWRAMAEARPDVLLLAGGTDGGDRTALHAHAEALAATAIRAPVVFAGNREATDDIRTLLTEAGFAVTCVENVLPRIGALNPVPARTALREVFLRHVIAGKHLSAREGFTELVKAATPDAVLTGVEALADLLGRDLLVVDVGGATTDVYSVLTPDAELSGPRAEVAGTAWRSRTVEGDLGVRHTAVGIVEAAEADDLELSTGLPEAARHRAAVPEFRSETARALADDAELSALAAKVAVGRHARGERIGGPAEPLRGGKDLAAVGLVVGSGGVLRRAPEKARKWLREAVCEHTSGGFRPPKDAETVVDADYALAPAGLLAANGYRTAAHRLLRAAFR
ncbi:glutamate mutase L [Glycomyces salinus]|uniref:glutamate mutase L n=1 Tax=Glycomyces salinus TaxID=980294 RepID=UPI0018EDCFFD|nr:glutamate mutase L [Glycomyces salinus]